MKRLREWIWPVAVLLVVVSWTAWRSQSTAEVRRKTEVLEARAAEMDRSGHASVSVPNSRARGDGAGRTDAKGGSGIDWERAVRELATPVSPTYWTKIENRIGELSAEELSMELDRMDQLDLPRRSAELFKRAVIDALIDKAPRLALEAFFEELDDGGQVPLMGWRPATALRKWAQSDPEAAEAWLDEGIRSGIFESKRLGGGDERRLHLEGVLISSLLRVEPDAAGDRLATLSAGRRAQVFSENMVNELSPAERGRLADLIRDYVPEEERIPAFASMTGTAAFFQGYGAVSSLMDDFNASSSERRKIAGRAVRSRFMNLASGNRLDRDEIEKTRKWLEREAPARGDEWLGGVLGNLNVTPPGKPEPDDSVSAIPESLRGLVETLHAEGGGDDLLVGFLGSEWVRSDPEEARRLAEMISDEARRRQVLDDLEASGKTEADGESSDRDGASVEVPTNGSP